MQPIVIFLVIAIIFSVYFVLGLQKETGELPEGEEGTLKPEAPQAPIGETYYKTPAKPAPQTPTETVTEPTVSPYFEKVKLGNVSHTLIQLSSQLKTDEKINVTGWKIKGRLGEITIPQGVELFIPGSSIGKGDITVENYDKVYLYSGSNPFKTNQTFRSNKCFGYLKDYYDSVPSYLSYSKICPKIDREEIWRFGDECQSAIRRLESCQVPSSISPYVELDPACHSYYDNYISDNLNYDKCIENYSKDENFFKNAWYIFVGYDIVCDCSDTLYLYDRNGLLVHEYSYKRY